MRADPSVYRYGRNFEYCRLFTQILINKFLISPAAWSPTRSGNVSIHVLNLKTGTWKIPVTWHPLYVKNRDGLILNSDKYTPFLLNSGICAIFFPLWWLEKLITDKSVIKRAHQCLFFRAIVGLHGWLYPPIMKNHFFLSLLISQLASHVNRHCINNDEISRAIHFFWDGEVPLVYKENRLTWPNASSHPEKSLSTGYRGNTPNDSFVNPMICNMRREGTLCNRPVFWDLWSQWSYDGIASGSSGWAFFLVAE